MKAKGRTVLDELLEEIDVLEKKKAKILRDVETFTKKSNPNQKEAILLIRRLKKLISNFQTKLEKIEKMVEKNKERR